MSADDPLTFVIGLGVLAGIGLFACLGPAWSASRTDATLALRSE